MITGCRLTTAWTLLALLVAGPLAPYASAQQPTAPATPPAMAPASPPASPQLAPHAQPDIFPETLKGPQEDDVPQWAYQAGAVFINAFRIPGKVFTCALGVGVGAAVLGITGGTAYRQAARVLNEGCGGKWLVTPEDLRPESPTERE